MSGIFVNAEGGLTAAGYALTIVAGIILFLAASYFAGKHSAKKRMSTKQLVFCAAAMALAFITSYIKIWNMPWGGSVTLCSMLFIVLAANWYGAGTGIFVGLAYGILQFIQEPYVLSFFQVCCDYVRRIGSGRILCKEKTRAAQRLHRGCAGEGRFSCPGRVSVLDGLHAGEFPAVFKEHLPDRL